MRGLQSIPQQIKEEVISGDHEKVLYNVRVAFKRGESSLLTKNLTTFGKANMLYGAYLRNEITIAEVETILHLVFAKEASLSAFAVVTKMKIVNKEFPVPPLKVIEVLSAISAENDSLTMEEVINAAYALAV